ncbi:hypothetical protein BH09PSE1_BH09PSE1_15480 [soil metagenome]
MEDLFRSYWWLIFPMSWFVFGAFGSLMNYFRHRDVLKTIKSYADQGKEPPEALLKQLERNETTERSWSGNDCNGKGNGSVFSMVLFGVMALGFGYAAATNMLGAGEGFLVVAFVMGALFAAFAVSMLVGRSRRNRD